MLAAQPLVLQDLRNGSFLAMFCTSHEQGLLDPIALKSSDALPGIEEVLKDSGDHSPEGNSHEQFK
jgi:hypothetical protein